MYDLIGDIHGHADELRALLRRLEYAPDGQGVWRHPARRVVFLGDYIDRGPKIPEVLSIVRGMVDAGSAVAIMGNHEFNAIAWHTERSPGSWEFLREHRNNNNKQHSATLRQFRYETEAGRRELIGWIDWFRTLPTSLELPGSTGGVAVRAVHACWHPASMRVVADGFRDLGVFSHAFMVEASRSGSPLFHAVETVLKGPELQLPPGMGLPDKEGHIRSGVRIQWFHAPAPGQKLYEYAMPSQERPADEQLAACEVPPQFCWDPYPRTDPPVFFGHYWLEKRHKPIVAPNAACLDHSVAKGGGSLAAYRWDGEATLREDHVVSVSRVVPALGA